MSPTTPQNAAGWRMEPPVSEPKAATAVPAATLAAEPPLDPPGTRLKSRGLRTGPHAEFSFDDPIANSSQLSFPRIIAPACSRRDTAVASYGGMYSPSIFDPAVVRTPDVTITSFTATGTPPKAGRGFPESAILSCFS